MIAKRSARPRWTRYIPFYVLALPGLVYLVCNNYLPMFGILIAFKKLDFRLGIFASEWCGFENFRFLFASSDALVITRNTVLYNVLFIVLDMLFALTAAIMLNEVRARRLSKAYQSFILLPFLMSWVIVSYLVFALLSSESGMVNKGILEAVGAKGVSFYNTPKYWPYILTCVHLWKGLGYSTIVYLSSIVSINTDFYEAARIDGAGKWRQLTKITLPLLKPTMIILFILSVGRIFFSDFGLFYQIPRNSGPLYGATETIDVYVYNALMQNSDFGMSSAAGAFQSVVGCIMVLMANGVVKKLSAENSLF